MPFHERSHIKLRLLDHLHLADVAILDGENARGLALDLLSRGSSNERLDQGLEVTLPSESSHGADHLRADGSDLGGLGVARLLELVVLLLGEGNAEHADDVPVGGTGIDIGLKDGLLLLDEGAELVTGHVHAMEVEEAVETLDVLDTELDLAVGEGLIGVEVGEGELDHAPLEAIRCDLLALGLGDEGLSALLGGEDGGGDKLVPLLLEEGVRGLLLPALLRLRQALVLSLWFAYHMIEFVKGLGKCPYNLSYRAHHEAI